MSTRGTMRRTKTRRGLLRDPPSPYPWRKRRRTPDLFLSIKRQGYIRIWGGRAGGGVGSKSKRCRERVAGEGEERRVILCLLSLGEGDRGSTAPSIFPCFLNLTGSNPRSCKQNKSWLHCVWMRVYPFFIIQKRGNLICNW